jgi:hypothetical protein
MCRTQGHPLSESEIQRIITLLETTDMSLPEIARRMNCTRSAIGKINKEYQVRLYEGRRSSWKTGPRSKESDCEATESERRAAS